MLHSTPYRTRRGLLRKLHAGGTGGNYNGPTYWGPTEFSSNLMRNNFDKVDAELKHAIDLLPKNFKNHVTGDVRIHEHVQDDGSSHRYYYVELSIPVSCRIEIQI